MKWILTIDVGNTNIVTGVFPDGEDTRKAAAIGRLETKKKWSQEELAHALAAFFDKNRIDIADAAGAIVSSVVPALNVPLSGAIEELTGKTPVMMRPDLKTGICADAYDLSLVGTDRLVDMAAAVELCGAPVAVWDLGTATTLSVVDRDSRFIGGMISAGVQLGLDALAQQASQLPALQAAEVETLLGLDTRSNMLSGSAAAAGIQIDGVAARLERRPELAGLHVVITGGLGRLVLPWIEHKAVYEPELLLQGLLSIYYKNSPVKS